MFNRVSEEEKKELAEIVDVFFDLGNEKNEKDKQTEKKVKTEIGECCGQNQRENSPAFQIREEERWIVDPFHDAQERQLLFEHQCWPIVCNISVLIEEIKTFTNVYQRRDKIQVNSNIIDSSFLNQLNEVKLKNDESQNSKKRIGNLKSHKLARLKLAIGLRPVFSRLVLTSGLTKKALSLQLGIISSFAKFLFRSVANLESVKTEKRELENELEKAQLMNTKFIDFFKRNQLTIRTQRNCSQSFSKCSQSVLFGVFLISIARCCFRTESLARK